MVGESDAGRGAGYEDADEQGGTDRHGDEAALDTEFLLIGLAASLASQDTLKNFFGTLLAARTCRRFRTVISLAYGTPVDKIVGLRDALRAFAAGQPRFLPDKVEIHIGGLGASCVELFVQVYFRVATYADELACRDVLCREVLEQAERLGVVLTIPTQMIHLAASGAESHPVPPPPKYLGRERPETTRHGHSLPTNLDPPGRRQLGV